MKTVRDYFQIDARQSTLSREVIGGATTFVTMAYIVVVNPAIMAFAGIPIAAGTIATILTAVFGTLLMGLYAKRPIAVAPYMGENAFLAFGLMALGITWQQRLGTVFVSGLLLLILTLTGMRSWIAKAISPSLKHSFAAGIGFFLAFIGLYESGLITSFVTGMPAEAFLKPGSPLLRAPEVPVKIGEWNQPQVLLAMTGFLIMALALIRKIPAGLFIGMGCTALLAIITGHGSLPEKFILTPFTGDYTLAPLWGELDLRSIWSLPFLPILLTLFLMCFLDTLGTLSGLGAATGELDAEGNFPEVEKPMAVDALTNLFAAWVGTSTSGAYIESAAGIREGARTGFASLVTAGLFALTLFFLPWIHVLQGMTFVYAPALILVGTMMMGSIRKIDFEDWTEGLPSFISIALMVFTYNIANGLITGLVLHPILKLGAGRFRETSTAGWILFGLGMIYFTLGRVH
jgi:AGZA family xanthine/uracil permease-like MFS transporter